VVTVIKVVAVRKARVVLVCLVAVVMARGYTYEVSICKLVLARLPPLLPTLLETRRHSRVFVRVH
jgi:hypothetical protein